MCCLHVTPGVEWLVTLMHASSKHDFKCTHFTLHLHAYPPTHTHTPQTLISTYTHSHTHTHTLTHTPTHTHTRTHSHTHTYTQQSVGMGLWQQETQQSQLAGDVTGGVAGLHQRSQPTHDAGFQRLSQVGCVCACVLRLLYICA